MAQPKPKALKLRPAARLKLFEGEWAGIYAREARKASFNAPLGGEPKGLAKNRGPQKCARIFGEKPEKEALLLAARLPSP